MKNSKQPAFPQSCTADGHEPNVYPGVTKREYFAAMAMQGAMSIYGWLNEEGMKECVRIADELLKKLEETKSHE